MSFSSINYIFTNAVYNTKSNINILTKLTNINNTMIDSKVSLFKNYNIYKIHIKNI